MSSVEGTLKNRSQLADLRGIDLALPEEQRYGDIFRECVSQGMSVDEAVVSAASSISQEREQGERVEMFKSESY